MVFARLLEPEDFGLVGMVAAITGILGLFRDFGLSTVTVQQSVITHEQTSTLFWLNLLLGAFLWLLSAASAPFLVSFYHEPRLLWITIALGAGFLFNAAGVQHSAILQREMRFSILGVIEVLALLASTAVGICMAKWGLGYWALVGWSVTLPAATSIGVWYVSSWYPGALRRGIGINSMLKFGGTITANSIVVYIAYNLDKILVGRYMGADQLGLYGRAYQLINMPIDNLNSAIGGVAFSALSRVQNEPERLKQYFLKGYTLVLAVTVPVITACLLFADEIIFLFLGPKWGDATIIFQYLVPTIFVFAMINPLGWLLFSTGMVMRSLKIAFVIAPLVIVGYVAGIPYGTKGVALGFSTMMVLWLIPHIIWCIHGTNISKRDIFAAVSRPLFSGIIAAFFVFGIKAFIIKTFMPITILVMGVILLVGIYVFILFVVFGQRAFYMDLYYTFIRSGNS